MFHQSSIYSASYAAIPHVVSQAQKRPINEQLMFWAFAGAVAAEGSKHGCRAPDELEESYKHSLVKAGPLIYKAVLSGSWDEGDTIHLLEALAAVRGYIGLAVVLSHLADGQVPAVCRHCEMNLYVVARDDGVFVTKEDPTGHPDPDRFWMNPDEESASGVDLSLDEFRLENSKEWLSQAANKAGYPRLARSLRALYGSANCPACGKSFDLMKALIDQGEGNVLWE